MSDYEFIKTETDGRLFIVTINRPDVMNCLHPMANQEMAAAFDEFAANSELWVAIVTGAGDKAFSAGNDLKFAASGQKSPMPKSGFGGLTARYDLFKPVIAAVNGFAMGGGFEIALATDIIIAAEGARFALPEPRVGFAALATGLHRLPRQVPMKKAMGMMLTGRHVYAPEGKDIGFVTDVVPERQGVSDEAPAEMGWADPRVLADGDPRDEGGGDQGTGYRQLPRRIRSRVRRHQAPARQRRPQGGPEGLRREASACLEERVLKSNLYQVDCWQVALAARPAFVHPPSELGWKRGAAEQLGAPSI